MPFFEMIRPLFEKNKMRVLPTVIFPLFNYMWPKIFSCVWTSFEKWFQYDKFLYFSSFFLSLFPSTSLGELKFGVVLPQWPRDKREKENIKNSRREISKNVFTSLNLRIYFIKLKLKVFPSKSFLANQIGESLKN